MKITIFGLTLSSSWGNGHATPYRAILRALKRRGARVIFYEKDVPYYARHRDLADCDYCELRLYAEWNEIQAEALGEAADSDVVMTASYTPDGALISNRVLQLARPLHVFYDLDTPITLHRLSDGPLDYLRREQIPEFDLYLSFTGGTLLRSLEQQYGARMARALYGCVDPDVYCRAQPQPEFACALSYLGTYAADRQEKLERLFLAPARRRTTRQFLLAGSLYPWEWTWPANVRRIEHLSPDRHPAMYSSSRATLNITREEMAKSGYCPSGRFFEATACGTPILTDEWEGLEQFFDVGDELRVVRSADEVISALDAPTDELRKMAERARQRTLDEHTGDRRAAQFLRFCDEARQRQSATMEVPA